MEIVKSFKSKKNQVKLIKLNNKKIVIKKFNNKDSFIKELEVYESIPDRQDLIPAIYSYDLAKRELLIEYIEGKTLLEFLELFEIAKQYETAHKYLIKLFEWLEKFHALEIINGKKHVLNDVNFRNFIVSNDNLYGFDFEDVQIGEQINDYIKVISMFLLYNPKQSNFKKKIKEKLVLYLSNNLGYPIKELEDMILDEVNNIEIRRKKYNY